VFTTKKMAALIVALAFAGATAPAALAVPPKVSCNSGNGNNSETDPANDCDPGNSGGHNNGGD
jgi:hypothetical protein